MSADPGHQPAARARRLRATLLAAVFALAAPAAHAFLDVTVTSTTNLNQVEVGETFTLDITIEETLGAGALALGLRVINYHPHVLEFQSAVAPASIFDFSPSVPVGGLVNTADVGEQQPTVGVRPGLSVNLFQGVSVGGAASGGPATFSVTFLALAISTTQVDVGAFESYSDTYLGPDTPGSDQFAHVPIVVGAFIPEPNTALLLGLGLVALSAKRERGQVPSAVS